MKRAVIVYLMLCFIVPMEAKMKPFGNGLYWELSKDGVLTISGNGDMPNCVWSPRGSGKWIKKAPWYSDFSKIYKVVIEEGVTSIGDMSFYYMTHGYSKNCPVSEVIIPNSMIRIGKDAFVGCKQLRYIKLNDGLKIIESGAFEGSGLKEIALPNSVIRIGIGSFADSSVERVTMSDNMTEIPKAAFEDCVCLRQIEYPSKLKSIGERAFAMNPAIFMPGVDDRQGLEFIDLPDGVESIGEYAFCGNTARYLRLPESVKEIGKNAFTFSSYWARPVVCFKGEIRSLPMIVNESNATNYGLESNAVWYFQNSIRDKDGKVIIPAKRGRIIVKRRFNTSNTPYYEINESGAKGIMDYKGNWIVSNDKGYSEIILITGNFFKVKKNSSYGIVASNGNIIIPTTRNYSSIGDYDSSKGTFAFTKKGVSGVCDAQGREISTTRLAPTADDVKANGGYTSAVEMKNGSTKYYKVSKNGRYGLTDSEGKEIVPCEMEALESAGIGYLKYKLNGFWGVMNYTGETIIDTDRGYTSIGDYKTFNKRFAYTMTGYKGECDATGRQLSKIKVDTPVQNTSVASSSNSSSSYSSNSSNNNSDNKKTTIVVEQHGSVPVQVWIACGGCHPLSPGRCNLCNGTGTNMSGNSLCISCNGTGRCHFCNGKGGHYEVRYQ